jgi:glutamate synthase (NADPH/NADH) large chain
MRREMGANACQVDCTFKVANGEDGLRRAIARIRREAEEGVRAGCTHVILTDEAMSPERAPIPMILATGAVHTHLVRQSLRTFTSLNVRAAECLDVHYFAVLVGVGATTVNAYLAQESIADRHARGLFGKLTLKECVGRYKKSVDKGLLKIMSKLGISMIASYRGGYNFEAIGLSRALVGEFFPGMNSRISGIGLPGIAHKVLELHQAACAAPARPMPSTTTRSICCRPRWAPTPTSSTANMPIWCASRRPWRCAICWISAWRAAHRFRWMRSKVLPKSARC